MKPNTIAIASDHAGIELKQQLVQALGQLGFDAHDLGPATAESVDYPDYANRLCEWLLSHPQAKGVLICGSGIGMSIAANRHKGIRAALCHNGLEASLSRKHNDANILCLGARMVGIEVAKDALKQFVTTEFEGGRHAKRLEKLK